MLILKKQTAFTLIELSIVLIIIGLVITGVIAGKSLVEVARLFNAVKATSSSPVGVIENLELWLETTSKDSFSTQEAVDGAEVTAWNDLNTQLSKKNAGNKSGSITYNENGINGLPSLYFPDDSIAIDRIDLGSNIIFSSGTGQHNGITVIAVVKAQTPNTNNEKFVVDYGLYGGAGYGLTFRTNFAQSYSASGFGGGGANTSHNIGNNPAIVTMRISFNSLQELFINGNQYYASSVITLSKLTSNEVNITTRPFSIGGQSKTGGENRSFVGDIGEIIVYSRSITNSEKENIENYLSDKWKIALTP